MMRDKLTVIDRKQGASSHHFSSSCCFEFVAHFSVTPLMFRIFYLQKWTKIVNFSTFRGVWPTAALSFGGRATHQSIGNLINYKMIITPHSPDAPIGVQIPKTAIFKVPKSRLQCVQMRVSRSYVVLRHQFFFSFDRGDRELHDERNQSSVGWRNHDFWGKMCKNCKFWQKFFQQAAIRPWSICEPRFPREKDSPLYVLSYGISQSPILWPLYTNFFTLTRSRS